MARNRETQIPIAGVLRLLGTWLWGTFIAQIPEGRVLPALSVEDGVGISSSDRLLFHPAFATWSLLSEGTLQAAHDALRHPGFGVDAWVRRLTAEFLEEHTVLEVLSQRLVTMSEWLLLAGEEELARLALVSASALLGKELYEHPFVSALVRRDLELAEQSLMQQAAPV